MPQETLDRLKPEFVVPAVTYMVSKECTDSGLIIEAGAGNFNRAVMVKGPGIRPGMDKDLDAEYVQDHWQQILSLEGAEPQWRTGQSLKDYLASKG
jgi:hypothetical protein